LNGTNIALTVFLLYWLIVKIMDRKGILEKYNISAYGPVLMIRTTRGLSILDVLAKPKKAWRLYADIGIVLMFIGMVAMFLIVILSDIALLQSFGSNTMPEPSKLNEARNLFLIPGVNEFIPFTWGILALVVTLVVHEFAHAILCRVEDIRVKSMGILLAVVPIGGFAEPDEEELFGVREIVEYDEKSDPYGDKRLGISLNGEKPEKPKKLQGKASRKQRAHILSAGVMANFVVAFIAFGLLFGPVLGAMEPLGDTMVGDLSENSAAYNAGIREGMVITQLNDKTIENVTEMLSYLDGIEEGSTVTVYAATDREVSEYNVQVTDAVLETAGVTIQDIVADSPAQKNGLQKGMIILSVAGQKIENTTQFTSIMGSTSAGQIVTVEISAPQDNGENIVKNIDVELGQHPDNDIGYLGVYTQNAYADTNLGFPIGGFPAKAYLDLFKDIPGMLKGPTGWIILLGLPIIGFYGEGFPGFSGTLAQFYDATGWAEPFGIGLFWIANALLWIGWLNFYVGLFNCLPAVPLDGGHVFRDYLYAAIHKITGNETKAENISTLISATFAVIILLSFFLMIFGPYLVHGF
jgi:membrane-associated protease RseP (regulator of RpoE activity)